MYFHHNKIFFLAVAFFMFVFSFNFSSAASYDFYVDKNYTGDDSDGSSEKPYKTIAKALEAAGSGSKKIYIKNGTYSENLTVPKGVDLFGQDKNKTTINITQSITADNTTSAKGDNEFKNLTFSGGFVGLTIEGEATIENCVIKNAARKGISLTENGSSVTIKNSKINGNGKGIYAQKGRSIYLYKNEISGNDQEGLDIREKVDGVVNGNVISGNGEGGIELIIGSSNLEITGNTIKNNKASGIANQFYPQASKTGKITISKNNVFGNKNFGIFCGSPEGEKGRTSTYWNDSLDLVSNKISSNGKNEISDSCELIEAISEDEKKTNTVLENGSPSEDNTSTSENNQNENSQDYEIQADELRKKFIENKRIETDALSTSISQQKESLEKNKIKAFFIGHDAKIISSIKIESSEIKSQISLLETTIKETDSEEIRSSAQELIDQLNTKLLENENFINQKENSFSLFGWALKLFART